MRVELTVNGQPRSDDVEPRLLLVHYLREVCGLRAANVGCDTTSCGACTVLLDGTSVKSCTVLTVQAAGQEVTTTEGLAMKGAGEAGTIGSTPAVQSAVVDAVSHLGVRHIDMPTSPQRVWQAIQDAKSSANTGQEA